VQTKKNSLMNFDPDRALQLAKDLSGPTRISADLLAAHLGRLGLRVERRGLNPSQTDGWVLGSTPVEPPTSTQVVVLAPIRAWERGWSVLRRRPHGASELAEGQNLALLVELAGSWSRATRRRVSARFAAVEGWTAARELAATLGTGPTLFLQVRAMGRSLTLVGAGRSLELARAAAADLWIPHRVRRERWPRRPWFDARRDVTMISLAAGPPDAATLGAIAQLATEIALRWSRTQAESADRSAQNPG
jgi:hypothetical protein